MAKMIFTADGDSSYRNGNYRICWETRGTWSVWRYGDKPKRLGRDKTIAEAIAICEADAISLKKG